MMTVEQWQVTVDEWIRGYGVRYFDVRTNALQLMEEVGELSRHLSRQYGEQSYKNAPSEPKKEIEDEMGDILFVLTCLANQMDINLTEVLKRNIDKKTSRDSTRHKANKKLTK